MPEKPRMLGNYTIEQNIYIGDKEVIFGTDHQEAYPFMVCYCDYNNPLSAPWPSDAVASDDYLEAMSIFTDRVRDQIQRMQSERSRFQFDGTPFTKEDCIPDDRISNIIGKVVVIGVTNKRYEYQHAAYQLILADGGNGASGGRGNAVFGTNLATGERGRWDRYDVLGELKPSQMPEWAKTSLEEIRRKEQEKSSREAR